MMNMSLLFMATTPLEGDSLVVAFGIAFFVKLQAQSNTVSVIRGSMEKGVLGMFY